MDITKQIKEIKCKARHRERSLDWTDVCTNEEKHLPEKKDKLTHRYNERLM